MTQFFEYSLFLCCILLSSSIYALSEDSQEKVNVIADSSIYNYKTGINIFEGNVKVDQGTTHITADKLITKTNKEHKLQEAIAYGFNTPAHYWTTPRAGDPIVNASAMIIKYYPIDANIVLEQNVVVAQAENNFQGQLILYNMNTQTITVPASNVGRAVVVYNPDENKS
ncbi:MAG: hypothetical protein ACD_46C00720G0001, partial [uncultured bacterium]